MSSLSHGVVQRSAEVFIAQTPVLEIRREDIEMLKAAARRAPRGRARLCAHGSNDDAIHEMLIVMPGDCYIRPHKHLDKTESFHVIEGEVDVILLDDNGGILRVVELGEPTSDRAFFYRLSEPLFHTLDIRSPVLVIHETTSGPFHREETLFAPWSPAEEDVVGGEAYAGRLRREIASKRQPVLRT